MSFKDRPLPKFGEWDDNDPASAETFTEIFKRAREEKKTGVSAPLNDFSSDKLGAGHTTTKRGSKLWFCCMQSTPAHA
ncbi:hypothetical protein HPP92_019252 [Vanilla planifolia]|uniref:RIN4 pathogenic type III effector avirulence factor Avr cleavage site domain-containing protein n=1 Tax=Vanilla planifolia TaxID=51239 RepID=A0A835Q5G0_VANPL|nr:hypothetical protein HPP92_019252 [Vanilla planifolia]